MFLIKNKRRFKCLSCGRKVLPRKGIKCYGCKPKKGSLS